MSEFIPVAYSVPSGTALLERLLPQYAISSPTACKFLRHGSNTVYRVECPQGAYILRVYSAGRWSAEALTYEVELLRHLDREGVPVAAPVPRWNGDYLTLVPAPEGPRYALLMELAPGRAPRTDHQLSARLGAWAAAMHRAADSFAAPKGRPVLDMATLLDQPLAAARPAFAHRPADWAWLEAAVVSLRDRLIAAARRLDWGPVHGDLFRGNCHMTPSGQITVFDFDECGEGARAYDLAVYWWSVRRERLADELWETFCRSYLDQRPLGRADVKAVPLYAAARQVWFIGQVTGLRADVLGHSHLDDAFLDTQLDSLKRWLETET